MYGFWDKSWLLGRFFVDFWPLVRFLDCGKIFGFCTIFVFLDDFLSFGLKFGFWVNTWLLDQFLAIASIFCRFLAFGSIFGLWTIFGFLDDFCHLD